MLPAVQWQQPAWQRPEMQRKNSLCRGSCTWWYAAVSSWQQAVHVECFCLHCQHTAAEWPLVPASTTYLDRPQERRWLQMYTCCAFCQALRDGQLRTMDAADLVPGDVILIRLGDVVPADVKLLGDEEEAAEDETPMQVSSRPS